MLLYEFFTKIKVFIYNEIDEIDKLMLYGTLDKNDEISKDLKYQS